MRRPQFSIRALLILMLVVAAFFGGIKFERERRTREERASHAPIATTPPSAGYSVVQTISADGATTPGRVRLTEPEPLVPPESGAPGISRMPTLRRRSERMPAMRDEPDHDARE